MPILRSRRSLPDTPLKTLVSLTHSSPNTTDSSVTNSQRRFSLRLASKLSSSLAEANESSNKRKRGSVTSSGSGISPRKLRTRSGYAVEETGKKMEHEIMDPIIPLTSPEPFMPNTSGLATPAADSKRSSRVSRRCLRTGSCDVSEEVKMVMKGDDGAEEKLGIIRGEDEQVSNAMELLPKHEGISAEVMARDSDWLLAEDDKNGEVYCAAQEESSCMSLRSGSRVPKRKIVGDEVDLALVDKDLDGVSSRVKKMPDGLVVVEDQLGKSRDSVFMGSNMVDNEVVEKLFLDGNELLEGGVEILASEDDRKGKQVLQDHIVSESKVDINVVPIPEGLHEKTLIADGFTYKERSKRYRREEKGKEKLSSVEYQVTEGEQATKEEKFSKGVGSRKQKNISIKENANYRREAAKNIAIELAHEFAFFKAEEEEREEIEEVDVDDSMTDAKEEKQEWFGPFSTALKIIEERESMLRTRSLNISSHNEKIEVKIPWKSSIHKPVSFRIPAPSLKDLCLKVLCDNVEEVESLEGLPDAIKHNIAFLLCHSRRMSFHALRLLTKGFPIEIYLSDCSWMTQEQFEEVFSQCNLDSLKVLQLDLCGRCLPDYALHSTFAKSPNCLSSLNRLSLKGAYSLSNSGLDAIISSASLLKSIDLSHCSLITSKGIISLAEKLGHVLQELYIDACYSVDAMLILPALKKLKCLEVLSIAYMETVTDKFFKKLIPISGPKIRGLMVAGCRKLTNSSLKTIGENCPHLSCLDIRLLNRLNDSTIEHLANGGCPFQTLKFCHGAFSDEALAALLETSGATLLELVLNNIEKAAGNTALAISRRCSASLRSLDLSFCRGMTDEALGLIVDSCSNLRILKLFGCTQVTNVFLEGHSNSIVKILGLKGSILDEIGVPVFN